MIHRGDPEQWEVKLTNITKSHKPKRFLGDYIEIEGEAHATSDFDEVQFTFEYTGRANEDPQKMMDFLKQRAVNISYERSRAQKPETLDQFINNWYKYKGGE
ncbi:hypothetical protein D3C85_454910 [compost metagenome]